MHHTPFLKIRCWEVKRVSKYQFLSVWSADRQRGEDSSLDVPEIQTSAHGWNRKKWNLKRETKGRTNFSARKCWQITLTRAERREVDILISLKFNKLDKAISQLKSKLRNVFLNCYENLVKVLFGPLNYYEHSSDYACGKVIWTFCFDKQLQLS